MNELLARGLSGHLDTFHILPGFNSTTPTLRPTPLEIFFYIMFLFITIRFPQKVLNANKVRLKYTSDVHE